MDRIEDRGDHPDQRINGNGNEDTESTNLNTDVTGTSVTSQGGSSSGNDDVSRKRILNPLEQNVVGHIQNVDGETVPTIYTGSQVPPSIDRYVNIGLDANFRPPSIDGYVNAGLVNGNFRPPNMDRFVNAGLDESSGSPDRVAGVAVSPIVHKGRFRFYDSAAIRGTLPKDAKKEKK